MSEHRAGDLETIMHKLSLIVSVTSLLLMIVGLTALVLGGGTLAILGPSVAPLGEMIRLRQHSFALVAMSLGIVLLALLPSVRVFIAAWLYLRRRHWLDMVIALVVLAELLLSTLAKG